MYESHQETAARYRRDANRYYRRSRTDARRAARFYGHAAEARQYAAWLTRHPDLWNEHTNPAAQDAYARTLGRLGDTFLHGSFHQMDLARHGRQLARDYDRLAADRAAALAS